MLSCPIVFSQTILSVIEDMSSSAGSSSAAPNEEFESIKNILHTLGIREYDPLVVVALSEYSRRKLLFNYFVLVLY